LSILDHLFPFVLLKQSRLLASSISATILQHPSAQETSSPTSEEHSRPRFCCLILHSAFIALSPQGNQPIQHQPAPQPHPHLFSPASAMSYYTSTSSSPPAVVGGVVVTIFFIFVLVCTCACSMRARRRRAYHHSTSARRSSISLHPEAWPPAHSRNSAARKPNRTAAAPHHPAYTAAPRLEAPPSYTAAGATERSTMA